LFSLINKANHLFFSFFYKLYTEDSITRSNTRHCKSFVTWHVTHFRCLFHNVFRLNLSLPLFIVTFWKNKSKKEENLKCFREWKSSMSKPKFCLFIFFFFWAFTLVGWTPPDTCDPKTVNKYLNGPYLGYFSSEILEIFNITSIYNMEIFKHMYTTNDITARLSNEFEFSPIGPFLWWVHGQ